MRMGIKSILAAAIVSGAMTLSASAAFVVTSTTSPGTGDLAGFDIVRFFGAFGPTSDESIAGATVLQSAKVTLTADAAAPGTFKYLTGQFYAPNNGAANPDVDVFGEQTDDIGFRTGSSLADAISSGVFVHDPAFNAFSVQGLFVNGVAKTTTANRSSSTNNPSQVFGSVKSFRVEGFVQNPGGGVGGDPAAKSATAGQTGAGALFATGIVPTGTKVFAAGTLSPDRGGVTNFDTNVPEPATFALIGIGAAGILGRRRRNA